MVVNRPKAVRSLVWHNTKRPKFLCFGNLFLYSKDIDKWAVFYSDLPNFMGIIIKHSKMVPKFDPNSWFYGDYGDWHFLAIGDTWWP